MPCRHHARISGMAGMAGMAPIHASFHPLSIPSPSHLLSWDVAATSPYNPVSTLPTERRHAQHTSPYTVLHCSTHHILYCTAAPYHQFCTYSSRYCYHHVSTCTPYQTWQAWKSRRRRTWSLRVHGPASLPFPGPRLPYGRVPP
jgi:hypothetical protein